MKYKVIKNVYVGEGMYLIKIKGNFKAKMGQFYMLRAWENYPLLSRPISIYDIDDEGIYFLYKVVGEGTKIISELKKDDDISLYGPYGNGFEKVDGRVALVGGGVGIAPLYMVAKEVENCDCYLGFREEEIMIDDFKSVCSNVYTSKGSTFVTDIIDVSEYDYVLTCGPTPMMKKIVEDCKKNGTKVMVSLENRIACGVGACLVCSCKTVDGNKKTCKDGPVFWGEDIVF